jgi:predicted DNA-binding ribbon-helix-helix protein
MKSPVVKRSVIVSGHKTSVSLEEAFWDSVKDISRGRGVTVSDLIGSIDANRQQGNLSSAIRLFVLDHFKSRIAADAGDEPKQAAYSSIAQSGRAALS